MAEGRLQGKTVLVTGGAIRVGAAICQKLAQAGAQVAVHCQKNVAAAEQLVVALRGQGARAEVFQADLSRTEVPAALVRRVEESLGPLAALVNSAARFDRAPFLETDLATLEGQWALNTRAPFLLTQAAVRGMMKRGEGDVVNILDVGGVRLPTPRYAAYGMSKAALAHLTETLAVELAPAVRVNAVAPGTVLPPERYSADAREALRVRIPQGRFGAPEDVADTVLFLLTGPRFITGEIVTVDGGRALNH